MPGRTPNERRGHLDTFWSEALGLHESVTVQVSRDVLFFTVFAALVCALDHMTEPDLGLGVTPFEALGAALGLLLVLRTNAGYDRWYEGRRLWGSLVNNTRALAVSALAAGPDDPVWRSQVVRWTIVFAHACRHELRGERTLPEITALIGPEEAARLAAARHMPTAADARLAALLQEARTRHGIDPVALLPAETARSALFDQIGGCERILKTPLPAIYSIHIRRFVLLFLITLPFGLLAKTGRLTPVVELLVAYPILGIDQIGLELQNPFHPDHLGHLKLEDICATIEGDLLALLEPAREAVDREPSLR